MLLWRQCVDDNYGLTMMQLSSSWDVLNAKTVQTKCRENKSPCCLYMKQFIFTGFTKTLDQITYADSVMHDIVFDCLGKSSTQGISGGRSFPDGRDPDGMVMIEQVQGWGCSLWFHYFSISLALTLSLSISLPPLSLSLSLYMCILMCLSRSFSYSILYSSIISLSSFFFSLSLYFSLCVFLSSLYPFMYYSLFLSISISLYIHPRV